jgi:hypothetical protein
MKGEMAELLGIDEQTLGRWAEHGIVKVHFYNNHDWQLYEVPGPNLPIKHCSRWDRLVDRVAIIPKNDNLDFFADIIGAVLLALPAPAARRYQNFSNPVQQS